MGILGCIFKLEVRVGTDLNEWAELHNWSCTLPVMS